tara:strand:- start:1757 stop:1930 length:174 start_codon:yes stop_codon:yes gene_type:complete
MSSKQDEFLDKLETLCWNYSDRGEWEWKLESNGEDGILFKFFYVDVEDEGIDEDTDE